MLKILNATIFCYFHQLKNTIYSQGVLTKEICHSIFIPLPKQTRTVLCEESTTINLTFHLTKILLKVAGQRLKTKIINEIDVCQYGFRAHSGTRNAVFVIKTLSQWAIKMQNNLHLCFVDYTKAFNMVVHNELMHLLDGWDIDD